MKVLRKWTLIKIFFLSISQACRSTVVREFAAKRCGRDPERARIHASQDPLPVPLQSTKKRPEFYQRILTVSNIHRKDARASVGE